MSELFDLEAEMNDDLEAQARADRARARVAEFNALPPDEQKSRLRQQTVPDRDAQRTTHLHGTQGVHDMLLDLEDEVIALLHPDDQERFRASQ